MLYNETSSKRLAGASTVMMSHSCVNICKWSQGRPALTPQPAFSPLCIKNSGFLHIHSMLSHHDACEIRQSPSSSCILPSPGRTADMQLEEQEPRRLFSDHAATRPEAARTLRC